MTSETSAFPLIRTKLNRPQIPETLVARPWLLNWLSQHQRRPLTLVSASAGYGKTTLISSWLETVDVPSAWLSLDEYDDDLTAFLTYVIAAIQTIFPEAGRETRTLLTAGTLPPLPVLARSLTGELAQLTTPFILVLDDYHVIHQTAIHDLLSQLWRHPPRAMHLVIITRRDPAFPITLLRARAQITEIRSQELRFTPAETAMFLLKIGLEADEATAAELTQKTEGWVTGLHLSALSLRRRGYAGSAARTSENIHYITDYLVAETLAQLPPAIQTFLLKSSVLDRLNGALCDAVVGLDEPECDGQAYLEWLQRQNLFIVPLDDQRQWYRYHHLFQALLRDQLARQQERDEIAALHRRASHWFAGNGLLDEALRYALNAGDLSLAAHLVEQNRVALLNDDKWYILDKWLARLPDAVIQQRPELLLTRAWVLFHQFKLPAFPPLLERIEMLLADNETTQPLWAEIDFLWGFHWFWQGQTDRGFELIRRALAGISPAHHMARVQTELLWAVATQMSGQKNEAVRMLSQWLHYEQPPHPVRQLTLEGSLIFVHLLAGELATVARLVQQLQVNATKYEDAYIKAWGAYLQAIVCYFQNDLEQAADYFGQAVEKRYVLHTKAAIDSLVGLALTCQAMGQPNSAEATQSLLLEFARELNIPAYITVAHACQARLALLQGDSASARQGLQTADLSTDVGPMFFWFESPRLTQCRVLIGQGTEASLQQAADWLQAYRQQNEAQHNIRQLLEILPLQALAYHQQAQVEEALSVLQQAVNLGQPGGFIRPFIEAGPALANHLEALRRQGIAPDYIGQILKAFEKDAELSEVSENQKLQPSAFSPQPLIDSLTDRELEILELLARRFSNKEIAAQLVISPLTVKKHTANIYQKLGVSNRRQAVSQAHALGLVSGQNL